MTVEIELTQGKVAIIDKEDYDRVSKYKWRYAESGRDAEGCGYAMTNIHSTTAKSGRTTIRMQRVIMDVPKDMQVDHINGDRLNNRKDNLRICTASENSCNRKELENKINRYKGIREKRNGKWEVQISHQGRYFYLGLYDEMHVAAKAYDKKARELHGEFANTNFTIND